MISGDEFTGPLIDRKLQKISLKGMFISHTMPKTSNEQISFRPRQCDLIMIGISNIDFIK